MHTTYAGQLTGIATHYAGEYASAIKKAKVSQPVYVLWQPGLAQNEAAWGNCTAEADGSYVIKLEPALKQNPTECERVFLHELAHAIRGDATYGAPTYAERQASATQSPVDAFVWAMVQKREAEAEALAAQLAAALDREMKKWNMQFSDLLEG